MLFFFFWTDWTSLEISPNQWKSLIYLGCIASGLGFFLWNKGATQTNHGILAAFNNAVVPLAVLCSLFIFGEARELNTDTLIRLSMGSFLIFSSILICKKIFGLEVKIKDKREQNHTYINLASTKNFALLDFGEFRGLKVQQSWIVLAPQL